MDYFEFAVKAKRNKEFDLALKYYDMEQQQEGTTVSLLMAIAKVYYLKGNREAAFRFNLAATHLSLCLDYQHLKRGDIMLQQALSQVPANVRSTLPHEIAGLLYFNGNYARHLAHAAIDSEENMKDSPELRPYVEVYYASILGDGSEPTILRKHNMTSEEQLNFDNKVYITRGLEILFKNLKWNQIQNSDIYALYF